MAKTYRESGVDINVGDEFIDKILPFVKSTYVPEVMSGVGGFAAHFSLNLGEIREPVLVSSTDGVGTKLKIAQELGQYDTIGYDLVAMCANDLVCSGAKPLFFLDYFAAERIKPDEHSIIIKGICSALRGIDCALVGGETAELPGIYPKGEFDLAGFVVGIVDKNKIIDGASVSIGDIVIGIASSGIHSNGYSLVRAIIKDAGLDLSQKFGGTGKSLGEVVLAPTKIYVNTVLNLTKDFTILALAHITGGGLLGNVPRTIPAGCQVRISLNSWERPKIFDYLQEKGAVDEAEMRRVFNLGIGMTLTVRAKDAADICDRLRSHGEAAYVIGEITKRKEGEPHIVLE